MKTFRFSNHLFADKWMDEFERLWNLPDNIIAHQQLAGTGIVKFILTENEHFIRSTVIYWDDKGKAHVIKEKKESTPVFLAPFSVWESLIYNYYTPIQAVVNKKMEFEGKMMFAVKFSEKFNLIADVAIAANKKYNQT